MRHPGGGGELADIIVRRLRRVPNRQRLVEKNIGRPAADADQLWSGERRERFTRAALIKKIAPDQSHVGDTDLDKVLARPVMRSSHGVEAAIRNALPEDRDVDHGFRISWTDQPELKRRTGVHTRMGSGKPGEINVTPMIDVLLVLIIIFMMLAPEKSAGLDSQVPQPSNGKGTGREVIVRVAEDRTVTINTRPDRKSVV